MTSSSDRPEVGPGRRLPPRGPAPWELDDLGTAVGGATWGPIEPDEPEDDLTAQEREIEAAYERGLAEGRLQGHEEGVEEGRVEGREEGWEEGLAEGQQREAKRLSTVIQALEEALFLVRMAEEHRLSVVEENLAALSIAVAKQIIGKELRGDADEIADMVRRALVEFPIDQPLRVRLSPQDLSTIAALSKPGGEAVSIAPGRDLRWLADPHLEPGSCIVEGTERIVDGRIDRALERIYQRLTGD